MKKELVELKSELSLRDEEMMKDETQLQSEVFHLFFLFINTALSTSTIEWLGHLVLVRKVVVSNLRSDLFHIVICENLPALHNSTQEKQAHAQASMGGS